MKVQNTPFQGEARTRDRCATALTIWLDSGAVPGSGGAFAGKHSNKTARRILDFMSRGARIRRVEDGYPAGLYRAWLFRYGFPRMSIEPGSQPLPVPPAAAHIDERQRVGFRLIIAYKFCKAALMLGVALWLTLAPGSAFRTLELLARELTEGGLVFARAGRWIQEHLSNSIIVRGAILAWLDSATSALEGGLLLSGKSWAQWVVIVGLAALLPFEALSIIHHPAIGKLVVLGANLLIVAYLARE